MDAAAQLVARGRSTAVVRRASPSSAGPAARTRTPTRGRALADAIGVAEPRRPARRRAAGRRCWRCPARRSTRPPRRRRSCCSAPDLKEELPVLYLRLRHAAEQRKVKIIELAPAATGLTPSRVAQHRASRPGAVGAVAGRARRPRHRRPAARRSGRRRRRAGQPRRVVRGRRGRAARRARRLPGRQGAAGAAPRQRRRRPAARPHARRRRPRRGRHPHRRRRRPHRPARAARRRPAQPTSPTPTWPVGPSPAPAAIIAVDTFLTDSTAAADVVLAAAAYGEKSGTTTNLEGRVTDGRPEGHRSPARRDPDWMIAAELAELLDHVDVADALLVGRGDHRRHRRHRARLRRRDAGRAALRRRTACSPCRPPTPRRSTGRCRRAADRVSYDYRLVLTRKLYDRAVADGALAVARRRSPRRRAAHVNPLDLDRIGVADGDRGPHRVGARAPSCCRVAGDERVPRGSLQVPFNVPGAVDHRHHRRRRAGASTSGWSAC